MQRIRTSLPYFAEFGWEAEVVAVDPQYTDLPQDPLLPQSIPANVKIHWVKALGKKWTSMLGFGSISYRSYWFFKQKVNQLLAREKFDLVYFSTTQFQICILGPYWKKKFGVPYVIDMQDPWHSEYYQDKPEGQRPPKYWLSYRLNKYLEPLAMNQVDGLISVSDDYINTLKNRYPQLNNIPFATITFGAFEPDLKIATENAGKSKPLFNSGFKNIVYIGRGGIDMHSAISPVFETLKKCLINRPVLFNNVRIYFIGTSYAPNGQGSPTIMPLAKQFGVEKHIIEITDRIGYYYTLSTLQQADALFIPGSDDPKYTASKIFPYLLTKKPLLAIFNSQSSAINILAEFGSKWVYSYDKTPVLSTKIEDFLSDIVAGCVGVQSYNDKALKKYAAKTMTKRQCELFNMVNLASR